MLTLVFAYVVNRHDPGMIEIRSRLRFGVEPSNLILACQLSCQNHFQGNDAIQAELPGAKDDPHTAASNFL